MRYGIMPFPPTENLFSFFDMNAIRKGKKVNKENSINIHSLRVSFRISALFWHLTGEATYAS
jgi:hypothetical protein